MAKSYFKEKTSDIHAKNLPVLKERIKCGNLCGCYVFYGNEDYTKNHYYNELCSACSDKNLNVKSIYGEEFTLKAFIDACDTYALESFDMFSVNEQEDNNTNGIRVVRLVEPSFSALSEKDATYFIEYLEDLPENTIVIFWFYPENVPDFSKRIMKNISEHALIINFKKEQVGSAVLITWILRHFSRAKLNIDRNVAVYLCSCVGNDMTTLKNEIDKCINYLRFEKRDTLQTSDVDFICTKSSEAQVFDITNYAFSRNFASASKALKVLENNREKPLLIFGAIAKSVHTLCCIEAGLNNGMDSQSISKHYGLNQYVVTKNLAVLNDRNRDFKADNSFAKTVSSLCFEYDMKLKSSRTPQFSLLFELIFKISTLGRI